MARMFDISVFLKNLSFTINIVIYNVRDKSPNIFFSQNFNVLAVFQSNFSWWIQKYLNFLNWIKITFLGDVFSWNYFLRERVPSFFQNSYRNVNRLWEEVICNVGRIRPPLWLTLGQGSTDCGFFTIGRLS